MERRGSILVALVCLSSPSLGWSWRGLHDQHPAKNFGFKPYHFDRYEPQQHPSSDYDSSSEEFWDRDEDYTDRENADEYGGHGGYIHEHHNNGRHDFYKHNHGNPAFSHHNHANIHNHVGYDNHENCRFDHRYYENTHHSHGNHPFDPQFGHHDIRNIPNDQGHGYFDDNNEYGPNAHPIGTSDQPISNEANGNPAAVDLNDGSPININSMPPNSGSPSPELLHSGSPAPVDLPKVTSTEQGSVVDADRVVFPDSKQAPITSSPLGSSGQEQGLSTLSPVQAPSQDLTTVAIKVTEAPAITAATPALLDLVLCVRACPVTPEYNPVCGSNNITYSNPGVLQCAKNCGVNVSLARQAPCPRPIPLPLLKLLAETTMRTTPAAGVDAVTTSQAGSLINLRTSK